MVSLTILGLGPGDLCHLTLEARQVLEEVQELFVRTTRHPVVSALPSHLTIRSFDHLYEEGRDLVEVYSSIARQVLKLAECPSGVVYAVPGHPLVGEESVRLLLEMAKEQQLPVKVIAGMSFLEPVFTALGLDPLECGLQLADATLLATAWTVVGEEMAHQRGGKGALLGFRRPVEPTGPVLVAQLHDQRVASRVKLTLMEIYPDQHPVTLVSSAGIKGQETKRTFPLYELDRQQDIDHLTCLYLPPLAPEKDVTAFSALRQVVARLRSPGGCPWDREQTHDSLKPTLLEETYEVLEALDDGDKAKLREELGDLLLQIVLHAQLAAESDHFTMDEVIGEINTKLVRRHPHVFGHQVVADAAEVLRHWDQIKREEGVASRLGGVPQHLPALAYAQAIQRRAARAGFDWPGVEGVLAKLAEEACELTRAPTRERRQHELGDLLFTVVNLARWLDVEAEETLRLANRRFHRRFRYMEERCADRGVDLSQLPLPEQDRLWEESKKAEG